MVGCLRRSITTRREDQRWIRSGSRLAVAHAAPRMRLWAMNRGFVVLPDEGRLLDLGSFQAVVLADGHQGSGDLSVLQTQN